MKIDFGRLQKEINKCSVVRPTKLDSILKSSQHRSLIHRMQWKPNETLRKLIHASPKKHKGFGGS